MDGLAAGGAGGAVRRSGDTLHAESTEKRKVQRLRRQKEFPHEVGLFLSYPPEDVAGFIANNARRCKCSGLWKVYGDEARAKRMFHAFKTCTADYCRHLRSGKTLEELVVAV